MTLFPPKNFKCLTFIPRDLKNQLLVKYGTLSYTHQERKDKSHSELRVAERGQDRGTTFLKEKEKQGEVGRERKVQSKDGERNKGN